MPRRAKGPRLYLRKERRDNHGHIKQYAAWVIHDTVDGGRIEEVTGCRIDDRSGAERALAEYIGRKHLTEAAQGTRRPDQIPVADVLALYARDIAPGHMRPKETAGRIERLLTFWGDKMLAQVNGTTCREFVRMRSTETMARRELEDLRAAVYHHRREGLCSEIIEVVLPGRPPERDRWLDRDESARLLLAAWRYREKQKGKETDRRSRKHVSKFILVGLYTGTRAGAICAASFEKAVGRGWIDVEAGVFYRLPKGRKKTKKQQPPVPLPDRLLAHLRRWKRLGQRFVVEWNGKPVKDCDKAFRNTVREAELDSEVTPHTLRHTAATWLMKNGTDIWEASRYLGMTVETLERVYGHHHPEHLEGARRAIQRHQRISRSLESAKKPGNDVVSR